MRASIVLSMFLVWTAAGVPRGGSMVLLTARAEKRNVPITSCRCLMPFASSGSVVSSSGAYCAGAP
jgi:hypothetical protein